MGKSRKSTIRKFEFYETITDNGIEMLIIIYFILIGLKIIVFSKTIVTVMLIELIVSNISMRGKATRLAYNVISEDIYK